jgi:hypothetical protein
MAVERHIFTTRPFACASCDHREKVLGWDYDAPRQCPNGHGPLEGDLGQFDKAPCVIPDGIPGGMLVKHAICNPDGSPRRFDSQSELREYARARGWTNVVEHKPLPGTDKSPHTTRWI